MKLKRLLKLNQSGFSHIEAGLALVVILVVASVGVYVGTHTNSHALAPNTKSNSSAAPCPSSYTCLGSSYVFPTSIQATFYACLKTVNLSKEGEPNQYTVIGYVKTNAVISNSYSGTMWDDYFFAGGDANRWNVSSNSWLFGEVTSLSHSVDMSEPNLIVLEVTNSKGVEAAAAPKTSYAGGLAACPS